MSDTPEPRTWGKPRRMSINGVASVVLDETAYNAAERALVAKDERLKRISTERNEAEAERDAAVELLRECIEPANAARIAGTAHKIRAFLAAQEKP